MAYKESELCKKCHAPKVWDQLTGGVHDKILCEGRQLEQLKKENKKLKASVEFWKDGWHELRRLLGWLWWHHPALDDEKTYHTKWKEKKHGTSST